MAREASLSVRDMEGDGDDYAIGKEDVLTS